MFKKAIAGVLSAVLCTSALLTPDLDLVGRNAAQTPAASPASVQNAADTGLAGSNAFSRFLAQKSQQPTSGAMRKAMPLKASAAEESYFTITDLKFDARFHQAGNDDREPAHEHRRSSPCSRSGR